MLGWYIGLCQVARTLQGWYDLRQYQPCRGPAVIPGLYCLIPVKISVRPNTRTTLVCSKVDTRPTLVIASWDFQNQAVLGSLLKALSLDQCLFNKRLPNSLKKFSLLWSLLWGIAFWFTWIERDDLIFNGVKWQDVMWDNSIDYGRLEWQQLTQSLIRNHPS